MSLPINRKLSPSPNTTALTRAASAGPLRNLSVWKSLQRMVLAVLVGCIIGVIVIVSTYYVENPKLIAGLIGGPAFVLMVMRWPEMGVFALLALTAGLINNNWLPLLGVGPASLHLQEIILAVLLVVTIARLMTRHDYSLAWTPVLLPVFAFVLILLLAMINGVMSQGLSPSTAIQRGRSWGLWLLIFPIIQLIRDQGATERFTRVLWVFTTILAVGVVARQMIPTLPEFIIPVDTVTLRTAGEQYSDVNRVFNLRGAALLYTMIPVTVATLAMSRREELSTARYVLLLVLLGLLLNWLVRSFQRSLWLSSAMTLGLLFLMIAPHERVRLTRRMTPLVIAGLLGIVIYSISFPYEAQRLFESVSDRLLSLTADSLDRTDDSVSWRVIENEYALASIRENPVLGIGVGSEYRPPLEREILWNEYGLRWYIHNAYFWIAVTMGLAGLAAFLALCVLFVSRGLTYWRKIPDNRLRAIYLGIAISFIGQMVSNITAPIFVDGPQQSIFPALIGLSESIRYVSHQRTAEHQPHEDTDTPTGLDRLNWLLNVSPRRGSSSH